MSQAGLQKSDYKRTWHEVRDKNAKKEDNVYRKNTEEYRSAQDKDEDVSKVTGSQLFLWCQIPGDTGSETEGNMDRPESSSEESRSSVCSSQKTHCQEKSEIPHGIWLNGKFKRESPEKAPSLWIKISIVHSAHNKSFKKMDGKHTQKDGATRVNGNCWHRSTNMHIRQRYPVKTWLLRKIPIENSSQN